MIRRVLMLVLLAASLLAPPHPAGAQATADQLNKLSLEALTARQPMGSYTPRPEHRPYRPAGHARRYGSRRYGSPHRGYAGRVTHAPRFAVRHPMTYRGAAAPHQRSAPRRAYLR